MKYLSEYKTFKYKAESEIEKFESKYGTKLDPKITSKDVHILEKAFGHFHIKFIKNKIKEIKLKELGGVHGQWSQRKKGTMYLNPNIFEYKSYFKDDVKVPYNIFIIIHEIGHCLDHKFKISYKKNWISFSDWKKCDIHKRVPEGYKRYIERRKGRELAGHKKSSWVHGVDAVFVRHYASRNPREDFADSFTFGVFKMWDRFKGCEDKMKIIKDFITKI